MRIFDDTLHCLSPLGPNAVYIYIVKFWIRIPHSVQFSLFNPVFRSIWQNNRLVLGPAQRNPRSIQ